MNKKYLVVFGLMGLFAVAIVSAVLVPYLSDKAEVTVDVTSPFEIKSLSGGQPSPDYAGLNSGDSVSPIVHGGDTYEVTFGFKALSNNAMDVIEQYVIGGDGTTCDDFVEIGWYTCGDEDGNSSTHLCNVWKDYNTLVLSDIAHCDDSSGKVIINASNHYDVGVINVNKLNLTLQPGALGNYSVSAQVLVA